MTDLLAALTAARNLDTPGPRCGHRHKQSDGGEAECSDRGGWTLDRKAGTWRVPGQAFPCAGNDATGGWR